MHPRLQRDVSCSMCMFLPPSPPLRAPRSAAQRSAAAPLVLRAARSSFSSAATGSSRRAGGWLSFQSPACSLASLICSIRLCPRRYLRSVDGMGQSANRSLQREWRTANDKHDEEKACQRQRRVVPPSSGDNNSSAGREGSRGARGSAYACPPNSSSLSDTASSTASRASDILGAAGGAGASWRWHRPTGRGAARCVCR